MLIKVSVDTKKFAIVCFCHLLLLDNDIHERISAIFYFCNFYLFLISFFRYLNEIRISWLCFFLLSLNVLGVDDSDSNSGASSSYNIGRRSLYSSFKCQSSAIRNVCQFTSIWHQLHHCHHLRVHFMKVFIASSKFSLFDISTTLKCFSIQISHQ